MALPRLVQTFEGDEEDLAHVVAGLNASGASLERLGRVVGSLAQGTAVGLDGKKRNQKVDARTQIQAARTALELLGILKKRVKFEGRVTHGHRQEDGGGSSSDLVGGIPVDVLRRLPPELRDQVVRELARECPEIIDAELVPSGLLGPGGADGG